ncbi:MAG: adenylate/guanylate cyclase domain-containing protein [Myxococcota bacterium]|nr:adenylate/guanylate cyclase domain-containing protein [Myxococcota bacterium]
MSGSERTQGTEIAALEARRNEDETRAEGALLGERRAALARLAMIVMFAVVTNVGGTSSRPQTMLGALYTIGTILTVIVVYRSKRPLASRAHWSPLVLTLVDFGFVTAMSLLSQEHGHAFAPGRHAIASSIIIAFAVARLGVYHVIYAVGLAVVSLAITTHHAGLLTTADTAFLMAGYVVLGFMVAITNRAIVRMFASLRQRDNLTRFLPRQVAERIMRAGPSALAPVEREITVLFSDIRGFTSMSEGMSPRELLAFLDDYFARMSQIVKGHDGVVGKFLGDGLLAFWGVPDRLDDHAVRAVRAARDMRKALRELNQHRAQTGLPAIRVGIGIHTGPVAAGMLGGALQAEYTVIGDAVNVASRIEGLTKDHGVDVLISETTFAQLPPPRRGTKLASADIRGRKEPIVLYTIDSSAATLEVSVTSARSTT